MSVSSQRIHKTAECSTSLVLRERLCVDRSSRDELVVHDPLGILGRRIRTLRSSFTGLEHSAADRIVASNHSHCNCRRRSSSFLAPGGAGEKPT
jgi:hypothetical protein